MDIQKDRLTIQEGAQATGLSAHTLRHYERVGLIHPIDRGADEGDPYRFGKVS